MTRSQPIRRGNIRFWLACCPHCHIQGEYDTEAAADNHHRYEHVPQRIMLPIPPTAPRAPWLQPEDRTGPEWMTEHDERL